VLRGLVYEVLMKLMALSVSTLQSKRTIRRLMNWKGMRSGRGLVTPGYYFGGLRKITKTLSHDSPCPVRDSIPITPQYVSRALVLRQTARQLWPSIQSVVNPVPVVRSRGGYQYWQWRHIRESRFSIYIRAVSLDTQWVATGWTTEGPEFQSR
jgi:hypothetical protein